MKAITTFALLIAMISVSLAGGSIGWDEVAGRIKSSDPTLVGILQKRFTIDRVGGATRIGWRVDPDRAGERIPPYRFGAVERATGRNVELIIDYSPDFDLTGRYFVTVKNEAGSSGQSQ